VDNSAQIRAAATKLFASHGYEGVSLQSIADEVGVAKQTLLYHFPSKEALRRAVIDGVFEHWRSTLPQILQAVTSGKRRFTALTEELIQFFAADRDRARLLSREILDNPESTQRLMAEHLRPWLLLVAEYIREGQKVGMIHADVDPESYVLHVIVLVVSTVAGLSAIALALPDISSSGNGNGSAHSARAHEQTETRHLEELVRLTRTALFTR
jgi:AcrR family transcriptional regulator